MPVRGIRGAITATQNEPDEILAATRELLEVIFIENPDVRSDELASILFTVTPDLDAVYPAQAARQMGLIQVPLLCSQEIPVKNSVPRCIRVLLHWNTHRTQDQIQHVYLREASVLRPDLTKH